MSEKTDSKLGSKAHMLETLCMAYRYVLADAALTPLPEEEQRELGRRLARYWSFSPTEAKDER